MGCGQSACYNTSPSTSVIIIATTTDGSATTITSTAVITPTDASSDSTGTAAGGVAKIFPSTAAKEAATEDDDENSSSSSDGKGGLTTSDIGGIIGGAVAVLIIVLAVSFFVVRRLKRAERVYQSQRETTSGSGTRRTTEKKSATQVSIVRVKPTPSEVDAFDYDPLMMTSSVASPRSHHQPPPNVNGRSRSGSDALSQPSGYSSSAAARWNTPSVDSDGDSTAREYFELPPRVHNYPGGRPPMRSSQDSSQYSYRPAYQEHGRQYSNASELSAGSDSDVKSQHGLGSPLIPPTAVELDIDGGFVPELPGSDTETESIGPHGATSHRSPRRPRRRSTGLSMNNIVSPMSTTTVNRPPSTHVTTGRRRGSSAVSPLDGQNGSGGRPRNDSSVLQELKLGSIDESATSSAGGAAAPTPSSMHGFFGSPDTAAGYTAPGSRDRAIVNSPTTMPGFVPVEIPGELGPGYHGGE
ncbi:hypothetical protein VP1G_06653 [Cytospora mali]|uniref:Uncharacterized protein n=1 Tax=Cytospora mali TaxID=578113 RepID=A0A194V670_CYTMA|nr:hypothetical protein VP1G_06653 [Valsa mali var. pyri (nom. inval.)]